MVVLVFASLSSFPKRSATQWSNSWSRLCSWLFVATGVAESSGVGVKEKLVSRAVFSPSWTGLLLLSKRSRVAAFTKTFERSEPEFQTFALAISICCEALINLSDFLKGGGGAGVPSAGRLHPLPRAWDVMSLSRVNGTGEGVQCPKPHTSVFRDVWGGGWHGGGCAV